MGYDKMGLILYIPEKNESVGNVIKLHYSLSIQLVQVFYKSLNFHKNYHIVILLIMF